MVKRVAKLLESGLSDMYNFKPNMEDVSRVDGEQEPRTKYNMNNRATLLILDRSFDLAGPLMHEYSYWNFVHEFLDGDTSSLVKGNEKTAFCFNQEDPYWQLLKTANMTFAQIKLEEKVKEFTKENAAYKILKKFKADKNKEE